jgi:DnaB-like helicase C terminal domain
LATLILGREIVSRILSTKNIRPYLELGMDEDWMGDDLNPVYASVFQGQDIDAYNWLLGYYRDYKKIPEVSLFRTEFPSNTYRIVESHFNDEELTALARESSNHYETEVAATEAQRYLEGGNSKKAAEIMLATARKVLQQQAQKSLVAVWDKSDYDIEDRLRRRLRPAPGWGVPEIDKDFIGFQDGELYAILGRAKSNKTTFLLQAAYHAWMGRKSYTGDFKNVDPRRVLFVSFEVTEEGIRDRLTCYGAGINPRNFLASTEDRHASQEDEIKINAWWESEMKDAVGSFQVVQPIGKFTIDDLYYEVEKFEPDIIFIDGFYFMTDTITNRSPGSHWEAMDNLSRDLKNLAMKHRIPVVLTHQLREKQLGKAGGGVDDVAMMGGTGLRMTAFATWTLDKGDDQLITIKNTANRSEWLASVRGEWIWDSFSFSAYETEEDEEEY